MRKTPHRKRDVNRKGPIRETVPPGAEPAGRMVNGGQGPAGMLYVVATPIGNLEDITIRAIRVLNEVSLVAAEDTRRTRILLDQYQIATPLVSLYEHNELQKSGALVSRLLGGEGIAYVSDAGTPGISDPGYILVREAILAGIQVVPIPGPSALIAAISVSGLPMEKFVFMGFLPSKSGKRRQLLLSVQEETRTLIFYESPHRLLASLEDIAEILGEREVVVSREMTKIHEEFLRGPAKALIVGLGDKTIKGELTLTVAGSPGEIPEYSDEELLRRHEQLRQEGGEVLSLRDRADRIALETGVPRRRIYRLLLFP
jgi:16S rRNA (cytidine1402-2'-O)-methyltransferase